MTTAQEHSGQINTELSGQPIAVGARTLQPVAHIRGWRGGGGEGTNSGGGAFVRLRPIAVHVTEAGQPDYTVEIADPTQQPLRVFLGVAAVITLVCGGICLFAWRRAAKAASIKHDRSTQ